MSEERCQPEFETLASQLQTTASRTNEVFDRSKRWRSALRSQLKRLSEKLTAADALLYQVSTRNGTDQIARLLGRLTPNGQQSTGVSSEQFSLRLLPAEIRESINQQTVIQISTENGTGGRLLQQMRSGIEGSKAAIIPIDRRDSKLTGLLVFICDDHPCEALEADQLERLTELLRLNGSLLLSNVRRQKKLARQRKELKQWRQIADCACDFALQISPELLITEVIPFGSAESCPPAGGLRLTDIVERTFHRRLKQQILDASTSEKVLTFEFRLKLGAEQSVWYHVRIEPRVEANEDGCMLYLTNNNQDKHFESEINLLNEQLVRASRLSLLGQMSTDFAHQVNQPLQAILGSASLALTRIRKGSDTPAKILQAFQQIETSVTHSTSIINSIRDFARYRSLKVQRVALASLLDDAIMMVAERASRINGEFVLHSLPDDCEIMADRTQSTHVFINLFVNALEATAEFGVDQPRINIFLAEVEDSNMVVVAVKDNGPGLPAENPEKVFDKFHTQKEEGLGLGLAISREVCESQQGSLKAINNLREPGCTFLVGFRPAAAEKDEIDDTEDTV